MVLAIGHLIASLGVTFCFGLLTLWIATCEQARAKRLRFQNASLALGVPVSTLEHDETVIPRLLQYTAQRYSADLLCNRLSDLCGAVRTAWSWLGTLLQIGIIVGVGWSTYEDGAGSAVYMWSVLAVSVFFWLTGLGFGLLCLLGTGRYPGESKVARNSIAAVIEQRAARSGRQPITSRATSLE